MSEQAGVPNFGMAEAFRVLRDRLSALEKKLHFQHLERELERVETTLQDLPLRLQILQESGIAWRSALSEEVARQTYLMKQAGPRTRELIPWTRESIQHDIDKYRSYIKLIEPRLESGHKGLLKDQLARLTQKVEALVERRDREEEEIRETYAGIMRAVNVLVKEVERLEWSVQTVANAAFMLDLEEALVEAVNASFSDDSEEIAEGVLFLTDRRLRFEQRQEVTRRRWLLFKREQYAQELLFDEPLSRIRDVTADRPLGSPFMGRTLNVMLTSGADPEEAIFKIKGDLEHWETLIDRLRTGRLDQRD